MAYSKYYSKSVNTQSEADFKCHAYNSPGKQPAFVKGRDCRRSQKWSCRDRNQGSGKKRGKQRSVHSASRLRDNNEEGGDGSTSTRNKQVSRVSLSLTGTLCGEVYLLTVYYLPANPRPFSISELQKKPCKHLSKKNTSLWLRSGLGPSTVFRHSHVNCSSAP